MVEQLQVKKYSVESDQQAAEIYQCNSHIGNNTKNILFPPYKNLPMQE
jgi:hypothetical protein